MNLTSLLPIFVLIPFLGLVISIFLPADKEVLISKAAFSIVGVQLVSILLFVVFWFFNHHPVLTAEDIVLFETTDYIFFIDFCFDKITVIYLLVGSFLTFLVTIYSRYYLHREKGYKRFFNTVMFFFLGYNLTIMSGNLETLFIGWEILGISSFLLIAFYRERYLPVKNAVKVFAVYRISDACMILAMWASHHFWHENITFLKLSNYELVDEHLQTHSLIGIFISVMFVISACVKSAQLPFSSWLPRAMEGPTPSSAIFYGSLSVHIGVFLLLRTFPFWEHQLSVRILIGTIGAFTAIIANSIARVQSSIKSQIAYASISQIGLIFIEVAAGFQTVALIHFASNAFLRTYQLLVSPSVVSYLIRDQFNNFAPRPLTFEDYVPKVIENTFFIISLQEWKLDSIVYRLYWRPLKKIGRLFEFLTIRHVFLFFAPLFLIGIYFVYNKELLPARAKEILPFVFGTVGLVMVLKSFIERKSAILSWVLVMVNHLCVSLAVGFNEDFNYVQIYIYLSGVLLAGSIGYFCLKKLIDIEKNVDLYEYQGYSYAHPKLGILFLFSCLGLTGFPITPTFVGEDLIFTHIHEDQILLAFFVTMSFIVDGLSIIRMYAKIFLGPHLKSQREMAYKSS